MVSGSSSTGKRQALWDNFEADDDYTIERMVASELASRLVLNDCAHVTRALADWLAPKIGKRAAFLLEGNLFDLLVHVEGVATKAGIAVERTRAMVETAPSTSDTLGSADCERWLRLANTWSGQKPEELKSLIPSRESPADYVDNGRQSAKGQENMEKWVIGIATFTGTPIDISYNPRAEESSRWTVIVGEEEPGIGATPLDALIAAAHDHAVRTGAATK